MIPTLPRTPRRPLPRRASVLGLGRTGQAVARFLASRGVEVLASDQRTEPDPAVDAALAAAGVERHWGGNEMRPGDLVVISPGIRPSAPVFIEAHRHASEVISEPELFARCFDGPVVAITGTDGKSTVTTWAAHLLCTAGLRAVAGGNLGNPLVEELAPGALPPAVAVIEISAFQLVTTPTLRPAAAAVTNIADDHLDHFDGDRAAYHAAKRRLVDLCGAGSVIVRPPDDAVVAGWALPPGCVDAPVGPQGAAGRVDGDGLLWLRLPPGPGAGGIAWEPLVPATELPLAGAHNLRNALMAAALARWLGADLDALRAGLRDYRPLPHRCQRIATIDDVVWIDDSKATNPHAAAAALRGLEGPLVLICGGSDKGADFTDFGHLAGATTRAVVLCGATADRIAAALPPDHPREVAATMADAVAAARALAQPGDTVLLSPACASFDQFRSYAHRGEVFSAAVRALR